MIQITDKHNCCGCNACVQACPKSCISMKTDAEGFWYPEVDMDACIDCHLCEKVCPCLNKAEAKEPLHVFAATNPNEDVRMKSSSGGIFSMLAENTINEGGVVFGARFTKNWQVEIASTETKEGIAQFRGSKYVQANVGESYKQCKEYLKQGRKVLYSGTPCQIAGLKMFLRKEYENLFAVEIACHGVPSPMVWSDYLEEVKQQKNIAVITDIQFRNKKYGWNGYHFLLNYTTKSGKHKTMMMPHGDNPFYRGFLNHLYMRPSCYECHAKGEQSRADITIADFWGIDRLVPEKDDNKGYSTIVVRTEKGQKIITEQCGELPEYPYKEIIKHNPALVESIKENELSKKFRKSNARVSATVEKLCGDPFTLKLKKKLNGIIHKPQEIRG